MLLYPRRVRILIFLRLSCPMSICVSVCALLSQEPQPLFSFCLSSQRGYRPKDNLIVMSNHVCHQHRNKHKKHTDYQTILWLPKLRMHHGSPALPFPITTTHITTLKQTRLMFSFKQFTGSFEQFENTRKLI